MGSKFKIGLGATALAFVVFNWSTSPEAHLRKHGMDTLANNTCYELKEGPPKSFSEGLLRSKELWSMLRKHDDHKEVQNSATKGSGIISKALPGYCDLQQSSVRKKSKGY
jgi:hypothetical protein